MNPAMESLYQKAKQALDLHKEKYPDDAEAIVIFDSAVANIEDLLSEKGE